MHDEKQIQKNMEAFLEKEGYVENGKEKFNDLFASMNLPDLIPEGKTKLYILDEELHVVGLCLFDGCGSTHDHRKAAIDAVRSGDWAYYMYKHPPGYDDNNSVGMNREGDTWYTFQFAGYPNPKEIIITHEHHMSLWGKSKEDLQ